MKEMMKRNCCNKERERKENKVTQTRPSMQILTRKDTRLVGEFKSCLRPGIDFDVGTGADLARNAIMIRQE